MSNEIGIGTIPDHVEIVEIENTCTCEQFKCPECGESTFEEEFCEECEYRPEEGESFERDYDYDCYGTCWDLAVEDLETIWERFKAAVPSETGYYTISGSNMGWRHLSGQRIVEEDVENLYEQISVNSEWSQWWTFDPHAGTLVARQSHHDAPMGEYYSITPATEMEIDDLA